MLGRISRGFSKNSIRRLSRSQQASPVHISTLANGLRVVTDPTPGHFSALGTYIDAGTRHETAANSGVAHMLDRMAFKSTQNHTGVQMMELLARLGGNYMCGAQRESVLYQASVFHQDVGRMLECMAQTVRAPLLSEAEVGEARATAAYELAELAHKPEVNLVEALHARAYGAQGLGMPLYGSDKSVAALGRGDVAAYHADYYVPERTVVAMVGVDVAAAEKMAESLFGDWKAEKKPEQEKAKKAAAYVGGELALPYVAPRYANLPPLVHMQIAFESAGLLSSDLYALATLQKLLGGGSSFSAGGPGKGMFSRLFRVLNQYPFVENCSCFHHAYSDSGLFGITLSCYVDQAEYMAQIACHELAKVMETDVGRGGITEQELRRAKNQLVSSLLMNVESKLAALEDIGRQVQCQGKVTSVDEMVEHIERLTVADVRAVAQKVLQGLGNGEGSATPTVVMQGDRAPFGDVEFVLRYFGLGRWKGEAPQEPRDYSKRRRWF
ncbi:putative mitochondrial-processing protease subunit [Clavispora lusitaniae]|uniref:Alpha-MPP n=1 Tax=Clavispora lusitaniae TaxID=36911 RepID=A0AA91Q383_CLALS|nr:putative mitochondrial-processing protease subunit [Clavispora lusitaniae]